MLKKLIDWADRQTHLEGDTNEILIAKRIWWICLSFATPLTLFIGIVLIWTGQLVLGKIFSIASLYWLLSMLLFHRSKTGIEWYGLASQLFLILFSFVMTILMGGIINSGGIILLGLIGPVYALTFPSRSRAIVLFVIYLLLACLSIVVHPYIKPIIELSYHENLYLFISSLLINTVFWFIALYYFSSERSVALENLHAEEKKSQNLLLNILPKKIVTSLKDGHPILAEQLDNVTILFADLVNFTPTSAQMKPPEIIQLLNKTFTFFDQLTDKYGLEKIKTIGDCYMAAAGVPEPHKDHAMAAVRMALEIQEYAAEQNLQFRIGINSGSIIAGVIGFKKFSYDLWGEVVNVASRLETNAPPGGIYISQMTRDLISDQVLCEPQGIKTLKGVGEVKIWSVLEIKP